MKDQDQENDEGQCQEKKDTNMTQLLEHLAAG